MRTIDNEIKDGNAIRGRMVTVPSYIVMGNFENGAIEAEVSHTDKEGNVFVTIGPFKPELLTVLPDENVRQVE
jgi:hypothetical protein